MDINDRIKAFVQLGKTLQEMNSHSELADVIRRAHAANAWFIEENVNHALISISSMLAEKDLKQWLTAYSFTDQQKKTGLILAGNLPLVGFHDWLCVLLSGNKALVKLSSQDKILLPFIDGLLTQIEPRFALQTEFIERLTEYEAVIATGSNNSARYFEYYFGKKPHIIRKNRNSVAILTGNESEEELTELSKDILMYFGLGCRNVSKLYIPKGYNQSPLLKIIAEKYAHLANFHKFFNNYEYNKAIYLVNRVPFLDNGVIMTKEDSALASPLSVVHVEYYENETAVRTELNEQKENIQCIVSAQQGDVAFGKSQEPKVWDYADKVDTLDFLKSL